MNPFVAIRRNIYLLQLENYHLARFIGVCLKSPKISSIKIIWTPKLVVVSTLAFALQILTAYLMSGIWGGWIIFFALSYVFFFTYFIFLTVSTILLIPIDYPVKRYLISKAKKKVVGLRSKLKIIGITGSYGKTTTKEVIASILAQKFKVLKTPENFNTPLGIARFILKGLSNDTEVLVVEMGAYRRGDIMELCGLTPPDIAVLTGINESHLERFGSLENTVKAKFEIVEALDSSGIAVLNADSDLVIKNYKRFFSGTPYFYASGKHPLESIHIGKVGFNPKSFRMELTLTQHGNRHNFSVPFLGKYIAGTINAGILIANHLGLT